MDIDLFTLDPNDPEALIAAIVGRTKQDVALRLLEAGADINARDQDGVAAAAYAGRLRHIRQSVMLLAS